jgi:hypothetical protein
VQAQKVLLKKLGVEVQEDEPDPDIEVLADLPQRPV